MNKLVLLLLLVSFQAAGKSNDCKDISLVAGEARACYLEKSDAQLKTASDRLIKTLADNSEAIEWFKKSQEDWVNFRDSSCVYVEKTELGAFPPAVVSLNCQIDFNKVRVKTIEKMIKKYLKDANSAKKQ